MGVLAKRLQQYLSFNRLTQSKQKLIMRLTVVQPLLVL